MSPVTTFASQTGRTAAATTTTTPLPAFVAGAQADVRGTLVAVHYRDERGFAIYSLEQADGSRIRALGYLPADVTLRAVVRLGGTWARHAQYGWQVRVNTFELIDRLDRRGIVAFLVAYTTHLVISRTKYSRGTLVGRMTTTFPETRPYRESAAGGPRDGASPATFWTAWGARLSGHRWPRDVLEGR